MIDDYAEKVWKDRAGRTHERLEDAWEASRQHEIREGMGAHLNPTPPIEDHGWFDDERKEIQAAILWFLGNPERVIDTYRTVCKEVNKNMEDAP